MLDFMQVSCREEKKSIIISPKFRVRTSKDLMIRGGNFYAIWDEKAGLWSTDEYRAIELIDDELTRYYKEHKDEFEYKPRIMYLSDSDTGMIDKWLKFVQKQLPDNYHPLDEKLIFSNMETCKEDYASKKLKYPLASCDIGSYERLMSVLYEPEERHKIEWAIGAIISGDSKDIQKFVVMYGAPKTGKSTVLNIIQQLFEGYYTTFDAKVLGTASESFALEAFKNNPLVAIQHDGDLSRIEDNTRLNSISSHEYMLVNEKFKSAYTARFNTFMFMGTNKPVKITDSKSGILRRLIDVRPSGNRLSNQLYFTVTSQIKFELGGIAQHCLEVYKEDPHAYDNYVPVSMMGASNDFYNYIMDSFDVFNAEDGTTLKTAWEMYKVYCDDAKVPYPYSQRLFKEELKSYFREFEERHYLENGERVRNYYKGFLHEKFEYKPVNKPVERAKTIKFDYISSVFDKVAENYKAQYANEDGTPIERWDYVKTVLKQIDTHKLHYVRVPKNHIVIDFDLKDKDGNKSFEKNLKAASMWPATYAELSKSEQGIHLHYIYDGDVTKLARLYDEDIEVKVFTGKSSLRRKLTKCNDKPIATINSGLPLKGEVNVVNFDTVKDEKMLRALVKKNLRKEIHPNTKPSVDFIAKVLDDAYKSGMKYDLSDLRPAVQDFAANSSNNSEYCLKLVNKMHFTSDEEIEVSNPSVEIPYASDEIIFLDTEVYPNLFIVVYKIKGTNKCIKMRNPSPADIESILKFKIIGFNNRRYDNHILYARLMGYTNEQLFKLSQRLINNSKNATFKEAYGLSYTDVLDFSSEKQSLKKFEIALDQPHKEMDIPWDKPVPENLWEKVEDYCCNDVNATEAVFNARYEDFVAREILADLAGMTVNDSTNTLTTKIIFGNDKNTQDKLVYTDLSKMFPGYKFDAGHSWYRGEDPGEGGYVYAEPGMYTNVALLDIASMHPTSIEQLNLFGPYTKNFSDLKRARIAIKHKDYETAKKLFNGKLAKYLTDEKQAKALSYALKIAINSVYGLTSASFDNKCRDPRNVDNIVAKRGALFMINLKHEVQARGFTVAHIKTDSIKIPNATPEIIQFVMDYGKQYGYEFEHEATYSKLCLVNDAVYVAKYADAPHWDDDYKTELWWTATGTQFKVPYVFKTLFAKLPIVFKDLCETKSVTTALYLDMNESLVEGEHEYQFVGKVGLFCPIKPGCGGGILLREKEEGVYNSAGGAKGYRWLEAETVKLLHKEGDIDRSYYERLAEEAITSISEFGDYEWFVSE